MSARLDAVRACFSAYESGDRDALERVMRRAPSSPPAGRGHRPTGLLRALLVGGEVFVTGFEGERIGRVEVYLGWDVE